MLVARLGDEDDDITQYMMRLRNNVIVHMNLAESNIQDVKFKCSQVKDK